MVDYDMSKSNIPELKKMILQDYEKIFLDLSDYYNLERNELLKQFFGYLIEDNTKCIARVWNKGFGKQCSRKKKDCDLCTLHLKQYKSKGLVLGTIYDEKPYYFNKYSI